MTRRLPRFGWIVLALGALAAQGGVLAQEAEESTDEGSFFETIDVNLVNVDVYVTDKQGNPVTGLTKDDFEMLENGRPVVISNFYAVEGGRPTTPVTPPKLEVEVEPLVPGAPPPLPRLPEEQRLHLIVYVDNFNIMPHDRNRVFRRIREFLQQHVDTEDRVMLVSFDRSLNFRHPFTSDSTLVANALFDLEKLTGYNVHRESEREEILRDIHEKDTMLDVEWRVRQFAESAYNDLEFTIDALRELISTLGGLEGRKALLYVSSGVPMSPGADLFQAIHNKFQDTGVLARSRDFHAGRRFRQLSALANANRVSFYTIDAAGLRPPRSSSAARAYAADPGLDAFVDSTYIQNVQEPLRFLAEKTGGKAILNTNDVGPDLERMAQDFDTYYSLGYLPAHSGDGRFYRIEVKVKGRKGLQVRHREGYRDKSLYARMSEGTVSSLLYGYYDNPLDVAIQIGRGGPAEKSGQFLVPVLVEIPFDNMVLVPREEFYEARLKLFFSAMDEKGDLSEVTEVPLSIKVPNGEIEKVRGQAYRYGSRLQMRRGGHRLAVGVRDEIGAVESFVIQSFLVGS